MPCCCVLVHVEIHTEVSCHMYTSGPDDPFCADCTPRHVDESNVKEGKVKVTQRVPRKESDEVQPKDQDEAGD